MLDLHTSFPTASCRYQVKSNLVSLARWNWTVLAAVALTGLLRWISPGPIQDLNVLAGATGPSRALGVSSNGSVIVGEAEFPAGAFNRKGAFRWTGGSLTDLIPGLNPSIATAVSADGTVVVGKVGTSTTSSAFRWTTQNPVAQPIVPLTGHATAAATAVSDNGKIVAGTSNLNFLDYQGVVPGWNSGTAFRWAESGPDAGTKDLNQLLAASGVNMSDITLVSVTGISPDGQWIQGQALKAGQTETVAFIAQFCDENIVGGLAACSTTAAPFTLGSSAPNNMLTVSAGQSAVTTITVTPNAGFAQPVSFSCGGLPVGAACSFNPATVTPAGGSVNTTLTITTDGGSVAGLSPGRSSTMLAYALTPFALVMTGVLLYRRRADDHSLWSGLLLAFVIALANCSGSDSSTPPVNSGGGAPATGTPAGTSTVTVTASSGGGSSGLPIQLTVTR